MVYVRLSHSNQERKKLLKTTYFFFNILKRWARDSAQV